MTNSCLKKGVCSTPSGSVRVRQGDEKVTLTGGGMKSGYWFYAEFAKTYSELQHRRSLVAGGGNCFEFMIHFCVCESSWCAGGGHWELLRVDENRV